MLRKYQALNKIAQSQSARFASNYKADSDRSTWEKVKDEAKPSFEQAKGTANAAYE